jgi:thiamine-monophosphate kinase
VGVKAAAQNLADVAAMGATATALLIGIATPGDLPVAWALDLMRGVAAECARAGAAVAGGDVTGADTLMLGVTALGDLAGAAPVTRSGARPGDILAVAGHVGWSAAGLALLTAGAADAGPELAAAHRRPQPPYHAGPQAARLGATAMIDISDGLLQDLGHVAAASGVSIDIDPARLPGTAPLRAAARRLRADWQDWALAGGEDHALAATFPAGTELPAGWTALGEVRAGSGVLVGSRPRGGPGGWNHFGGGAQELSAGTPAKSRTGVADLPPA